MTACLILYMMEQVRPPDIGHDLVFCCFDDSLFVVYLCFWWGAQGKDCWSPAVYLFLCLSAGCGRWLRECWSHPGKQREPAAAEPGSESSEGQLLLHRNFILLLNFHLIPSQWTSIWFLGILIPRSSIERKKRDFHLLPWQRTSSHSIAADFHSITFTGSGLSSHILLSFGHFLHVVS